MCFFRNWLHVHRLLLLACPMFLFGGAVRFFAGFPFARAFFPAAACICGTIMVWISRSPLKRIRLRTLLIVISAILFLYWFFDRKMPLSWLPGLLSPLVIAALFFPRKRSLYCKLVFLSLFFGILLRGNTALFFLAALSGGCCLYDDPAVKSLPSYGRKAALFIYLLAAGILFCLFNPDLTETFFLWRALLIDPSINADGAGFWNLQVRQALLSTPFRGQSAPHAAIRAHMPIVSAVCSHGLWLLLLLLFACGFFWSQAIRSLLKNPFPLRRRFAHSIILIQLFRTVTGIAGILGWRLCITYGVPFFGCALRDWILDAALTGLLLAAFTPPSDLCAPTVPVVKAHAPHPIRKQRN